MTDPAQWFDRLGTCSCGKPATGTLMGTRNQPLGKMCERCAERRIKNMERVACPIQAGKAYPRVR